MIKGIMCAEDAMAAQREGADGVVVSNHGGRQLDGAPATIEILSEIVSVLDQHMTVLLDGGVRRGSDIVKALALGADAVLLGRAPLYGLAARGRGGGLGVQVHRASPLRFGKGCHRSVTPDPTWIKESKSS